MTDLSWTNARRRLRDLVPWEHNPKRMTKKQADGLRASLEHFGFAIPFLVSPANDIYDGHQRQQLMALMREYGNDAEVDVRVSSRPLSDDERRELVVRLKQNQAGWDFDMLGNLYEPEELIEWGFEESELGLLPDDGDVGRDTEPQVDRAEELRVKWGVEPGQLWALGEHRLICGDCTDAEVVARVMGGERATLAPVDPPYNVGFDYDGQTVDDSKEDDAYERFTRAWFAVCQSVSDRQIVTPGLYNLASWLRWFSPKHWGTWIKRNTQTHGLVTMFLAWEPILFFGAKWKRTRHLDIFDFPAQFNTQKQTANHPCPKPLTMWEDLLTHYSELGDAIYDAFLGSGTTLIACENLGRRCRAAEIAPGYVAVALERWATHTSRTPELVE